MTRFSSNKVSIVSFRSSSYTNPTAFGFIAYRTD